MLNPSQIGQFHADAYLILLEYFPRKKMDLLLAVARADQALEKNAKDRLDSEGRLSLRCDLPECAYSAYVRHRNIVEPMEQLLGEEIFHYHHKMMLKEPLVGGTWE